ncbi:MAG: diguanylate cyclase domain-containing protein [Candidatus Dormibacteria bacterium]
MTGTGRWRPPDLTPDQGPRPEPSEQGVEGERVDFLQRVALGRALENRTEDLSSILLKSGSFPAGHPAIARAVLATQLIGRWLATGEGGNPAELLRIASLGEELALRAGSLAEVTKGYLIWRDGTLELLAQEASRLKSDRALVAMARQMVRASCDSSLVRMARHYDAARLVLQEQLESEHAKLAYQTLHDPLTGLANRTLFADRLAHVQRAVARRHLGAAVLFLDLDRFKTVNDQFGHACGDQLLIAVAGRLTEMVRAADTAARLSGDEFVLLIEDLRDPISEATALADRIRAAFARPFLVEGTSILVSVSVGIAPVGPADDPEAIIACADTAMYQTKRVAVDLPGADTPHPRLDGQVMPAS